MNRKWVIIFVDVIVIVAVVVSLFVYLNRKPQQESRPVQDSTSETKPLSGTATVTYSDKGFSPAEITITKGTTITFDNQTEIPMWVASDPHPDHTDYPEFDVIRVNGQYPEPKNGFSFTFDLPGTWTYHNHTMPGHTAKITVK